MPKPRSGHSANIYNDKCYMFGGILELTKELNECLCFDLKTQKLDVIGSSASQEAQQFEMSANLRADESPSAIHKQNTLGSSPNKLNRRGTIAGLSPSKTFNKSPTKTRKKSPSKKLDGTAGEKKESGLISPTSISMQNTFIIKNADESFDAYYQQMKKRKMGGGMDNTYNTGHSATLGGSSPGQKESNFGIVNGIQPAARDGHTTEISHDGWMFVFGGDRHHMPFNDLYVMQL
jgi:hypothetical protein